MEQHTDIEIFQIVRVKRMLGLSVSKVDVMVRIKLSRKEQMELFICCLIFINLRSKVLDHPGMDANTTHEP